MFAVPLLATNPWLIKIISKTQISRIMTVVFFSKRKKKMWFKCNVRAKFSLSKWLALTYYKIIVVDFNRRQLFPTIKMHSVHNCCVTDIQRSLNRRRFVCTWRHDQVESELHFIIILMVSNFLFSCRSWFDIVFQSSAKMCNRKFVAAKKKLNETLDEDCNWVILMIGWTDFWIVTPPQLITP